MYDLTVGQCFSEGWAAMKKHMAPAIVGNLVLLLIWFAMGVIPYLGSFASLILSGPLMGGMFFLFLNIIMDRNPQIGDVFKGFSRFGAFLGLYWLMALITLACILPAAILTVIAAAASEEVGIVVGIVTVLAAIVAMIIIMLRYYFAYFILADDPNCGVIEAFKRSAALTEGYRGTIFLIALVAGLLAMAGYLACLVGIVFTAPLCMCMIAAAYKQLKLIAYGPESLTPAYGQPPYPGQPPYAASVQPPFAPPAQPPLAAPGQPPFNPPPPPPPSNRKPMI
jgi:uncharacterized membrane protein